MKKGWTERFWGKSSWNQIAATTMTPSIRPKTPRRGLQEQCGCSEVVYQLDPIDLKVAVYQRNIFSKLPVQQRWMEKKIHQSRCRMQWINEPLLSIMYLRFFKCPSCELNALFNANKTKFMVYTWYAVLHIDPPDITVDGRSWPKKLLKK